MMINRLNPAFTIIELLIVISILAFSVTLVSTSYLGFERRERIKSAALEMKNKIRAAQNKALSGDKGMIDEGDYCEDSSELVGWYVNIDPSESQSGYKMAG